MTMWPWSRRGRQARELDDELRFHREMRVAEFMARGNTREQAERLARERFGDVGDLREYCHRMDTHIATRRHWSAWFSDFRLDLWHGLRQVRQHHGVALVAILTLGLGIGATTATYAVVHKLLISPMPGINGDRVVRLSRTNKERSFSISATLEIADAWRAGVPALEEVATYASREVTADFGSGKQALDVGVMAPNFLSVFGISPAMGRPFAEGDANVALISSGVWRQRYGASANVLGKTIHLDGVGHTIVGVLPRQFVIPFATGGNYDVWVPLNPAGPRVFPAVVARLRPGTSKDTLQRELDTILASLAETDDHSGMDRAPWQAMISRPQDDLGQTTEDSVLVLFGAVGIVLLAGCANVANLLLARAQTRHREFVIRHALGAGRGRLVRQLLAESSLLAIGGWLLGLVVTVGCIELAQALRPSSLAALDGLLLEPRLIWISMLISVITAGLFGLAPALVAAGRRPSAGMKRQALSTTADRRVGRWRNALVIVEVGLSVVLLVGGGLLIRTLWAMQHAPLGFDPTHLVSAEITLPIEKYTRPHDRAAAFQRLLDQVKVLPGVTQATWALGVPPNLGISVGAVQIEGAQATEGAREFIGFNTASPDYFALTKTPIVEGRLYDPGTQHGDAMMVSQSMARKHWPGESAVGKRMRLGTEGPWSTIVGVVGDVTIPRPGTGARAVREVVYSPFDGSIEGATIVIRGSGALTALFPALTAAAAQIDPQIKISSITSVTDALAQSQSLPRFIAGILSAFAVMAVLLASVGLYGVIAYTVTRRWREMGIRLALGARPGDVVRPVLWEGAWMTALGLAAGLAGAYAATGALRSLLFQVQPLDLTTFVLASALLALVSFAAIYMPARRATRVNPLMVLREE